MDSAVLDALWRSRKDIMPGANEDEIQHAFTELLAGPWPSDTVGRLRELGIGWRRGRTAITKKEVSTPLPTAFLSDEVEGAEQQQEQLGYYHAPTIEAAELADAVNHVVQSMPWESGQAYILIHLRGVEAAEAALLLDMDEDEVLAHAEGVNGLVASSLVKSL